MGKVRPADGNRAAVRVRFRLAAWGPIGEDLNQSARNNHGVRKDAYDCDCHGGCVDATYRRVKLQSIELVGQLFDTLAARVLLLSTAFLTQMNRFREV